MRRKTLVAAFAGAIALVPFLAACGGDDEEANGEPAVASQTIEISGTEYQFDPSTVSVDGPGTYTFRLVNDGEEPHALEIEGTGIEEETDTIGPGESAEVTVELTEAGDYEMYCPVDDHRGQGMEGTLTVSDG